MPTLRICGVKVVRVAVRHGGTTTTEPQQLTFSAFFKLLVLTIKVHFRRSPQIVKRCLENIAHLAFKAAAGHHITVGQDGEMPVAAVAAVVNGVFIQSLGNLELADFVQVQAPKMVFQVEGSLATVAVVHVLFPTGVKHLAVLLRRKVMIIEN